MKQIGLRIALATLLIGGLTATSAFAQKFEIYPYAGGQFWNSFTVFPDQTSNSHFMNPGLFGVKAGGFVSSGFQIEGNLGWTNRFRLTDGPNFDTRSFIYEANGTFNFLRRNKFYPYLTVGAGGMTLRVNNSDSPDGSDTATFLIPVEPFSSGGAIPFTTRPFTWSNNDTFFTFSWGGGVKALRLWGPVGLRLDLRGRTVPNFFGNVINAFEPTGGVLLTWGE
jgi:hypothetical protein